MIAKKKKKKKRSIAQVDELVIERENSSSKLATDGTLIPTGLSELNLICSGNVNGGIPAGGLIHVVGDSDSGKTLWCMTALAAVANNPKFDDYAIIYMPTEGGFSFNVPFMFGGATDEKLQIINLQPYEKKYGSKKKVYKFHNTVDDWGPTVVKLMQEQKCVLITDSIDGLSCEDWQVAEACKDTGDDEGGSMGMEKAKALHKALRNIRLAARATGSVMFYISQSKQKVGFGHVAVNYSGGDALKFYADLQTAISVGGKPFYKTIKSKPHKIGSQTKIKVLKNHINGKGGAEIIFRILHNYGIDDMYGVIQYLHTYRWTGKKKAEYSIDEIGCDLDLNLTATTETLLSKELKTLVEWVETNNKTKKTRRLMQKSFHALEAELTPNREKRF